VNLLGFLVRQLRFQLLFMRLSHIYVHPQDKKRVFEHDVKSSAYIAGRSSGASRQTALVGTRNPCQGFQHISCFGSLLRRSTQIPGCHRVLATKSISVQRKRAVRVPRYAFGGHFAHLIVMAIATVPCRLGRVFGGVSVQA